MSDPSPKSNPGTLRATPRSISSPGSAAGPTPSDSLAGPTTTLSGPVPAPASLSVGQVALRRWATSGTYGPLFIGSSPSAILQSSLESKLQAVLGGNGSPEYVLTWKHWDMPSGPPICVLRASGRRTSGNGCSGWPTPNAGPQNDNDSTFLEHGFGLTLGMAAQLVGWTTPQAHDATARGSGQKANHGTKHGCADLNRDARVAGWATPRSSDVNANPMTQRGLQTLPGQALAGSPARTGKRGVLNPALPRWLMGFPADWANCAPTATPSCRRSPRCS